MTSNFREMVCAYVAEIPPGRVMTYGQLAALSGSPRAARIVGGIAHWGPEGLPWHRVVNRHGRLALGFPGGRLEQKSRLEAEGITVNDVYEVDIDALLWWPQQKS